MQIILGSKSKGRRNILRKMGYKFSVMDPNIDEKSIRLHDPKKLVLALARAKAKKLLPLIKKPSLLITADQIVLCNHKILEKPKDFHEARQFLDIYAKYPAQTISAIVVTNTQNKKQVSAIDVAQIYILPIPPATADQIASQDYVLHCAGGFSLDDKKFTKYVEKIVGTKDSITGLPIKLTERLLKDIAVPGI
jgi:septum formation protein